MKDGGEKTKIRIFEIRPTRLMVYVRGKDEAGKFHKSHRKQKRTIN